AARILLDECPGLSVTCSHQLGRIGLIERENATLLNACLVDLAGRTTRGFIEALERSGIRAPLYITQNDGTVLLAEQGRQFPVYSFASGPTNSMRGAAFLSRRADALVVDVGGTTTDIGALCHGFPREANNVVEVGGVRTLFRMPDLLSLGLGGGSHVAAEPLAVGPLRVGYRLTGRARGFGGARPPPAGHGAGARPPPPRAGGAGGAPPPSALRRVADLPKALVEQTLGRVRDMLEEGIDRMKTEAAPVPLIAVGGGCFVIPERLAGVSEVVHVPHQAVANAVGAAIAQVSGEVDQI